MSKTGHAEAWSSSSEVASIASTSVMTEKVRVATELPKTSWAQVRTPAGVTSISLEIKRRSRLSRGRSISR